ncbi:hypothetical protein [Aureivirga marina]|uniref:hypothetical protein n=1 Tax=Aureivirga marina TaxID=1182451 RepID=UPI0018C9B6EE|nr:hypothetical protein [Aureivirga marina]
MKRKRWIRIIFIIVFAGISFFISYGIIYNLLIPDPCFYHTNEMNSFMKLFYGTFPGENGHPSPNLFNIISSLFIGGFIGNYTYLKVLKLKYT